MCGYMSLFFLIQRNKGKQFNDIVKMFQPKMYHQNEIIVKKFFSKTKFPKQKECSTQCAKTCKMNNMNFQKVCIQKNNKCFQI